MCFLFCSFCGQVCCMVCCYVLLVLCLLHSNACALLTSFECLLLVLCLLHLKFYACVVLLFICERVCIVCCSFYLCLLHSSSRHPWHVCSTCAWVCGCAKVYCTLVVLFRCLFVVFFLSYLCYVVCFSFMCMNIVLSVVASVICLWVLFLPLTC